MSSIGNYKRALDTEFDKNKMIKSLEYKLSKTEDGKLKNAIKMKLKSLKSNQTINKDGN